MTKEVRTNFRNSVLPLSTNSILDPEEAGHWGTAFVLDDKGTIVTAEHVVKDLQRVVNAHVASTGSLFLTVTVQQSNDKNSYFGAMVDVVKENQALDVAILRCANPQIASQLEPLQIDDRSETPIGEEVKIVGYPALFPYSRDEWQSFPHDAISGLMLSLRLDPIVTFTQVGGVGRLLVPPSPATNWHLNTGQYFLTLDHPAGPGNSGGPVLSTRSGKVVGMVVRTNANGYSFAVKGSDLRQVLAIARGTS